MKFVWFDFSFYKKKYHKFIENGVDLQLFWWGAKENVSFVAVLNSDITQQNFIDLFQKSCLVMKSGEVEEKEEWGRRREQNIFQERKCFTCIKLV